MKNEKERYLEKAKELIDAILLGEDVAADFTTEEIGNDYIVGQALELTRQCIINGKMVNLKNILYFITWEDEICNLEEEMEKLFSDIDFTEIAKIALGVKEIL